MSDKQKGLIDSILELFPNSSSRTCVRHLYNNFKLQSQNQGKALKDALWKAARATYMKEWTDAMNELKAMSEPAFNWLVAKDPKNWSKAHFSTNCKSDMLLNNLCESFNKMILESRDKPILTMMEMIRCKIMTRIASKKEAAEKIIGTLCPKIQKKLEKIIEQSIRCWPRNAGGQRWEVSAGFEDQHAVDLEAQTCSCRKWDLTGIPCIHVASVILHIGARPEDFVNSCYRKDTQLEIYSHMVKPVRGPKQWVHYQTDEPLLPPVIRRPVGRPQTKRRKEPDEQVKKTGKMSKLGVHMTCSKCGSKGRNKRSCRGQVGGNARSARMAPRRNTRPSRSNTSEPMPTGHARVTSEPMPTGHARVASTSRIPTGSARPSKLPVRRPTCSNSVSSTHPTNNQHHEQGSQRTMGPVMTVRWMPSQQSSVQGSQTQENVSNRQKST
ncbi:hypothetical protein HRI_005274500 [Hibiscus trionum]|uniref:SWIM-type domain-containing protein n=1 Tax=Hibiscus trionum TaxID=183268 RepID=A0A9W7JJV1_HIBTR|nr:hypothetical protein HRI_005274500 [Hibiscus trionum]